MSSRKAIHNKSLLQSNVLLRILVKDFYFEIIVGCKDQSIRLQTSDFRPQTSDFILVKDYSFLVIELFLAKQHFIKDFLQDF